MNVDDEDGIRAKYTSLAPTMSEAATRLWAAAEARALGHGGIVCVMLQAENPEWLRECRSQIGRRSRQ